MKLVFAKSAQGVEFLPWPMSYIQRSNHRLCFPHKQRLLLFSVFYQVFLLTWLWDAFMHLLRYLVCVSMATPCPEFWQVYRRHDSGFDDATEQTFSEMKLWLQVNWLYSLLTLLLLLKCSRCIFTSKTFANILVSGIEKMSPWLSKHNPNINAKTMTLSVYVLLIEHD